jgi:PAS domain S-box-containing protein
MTEQSPEIKSLQTDDVVESKFQLLVESVKDYAIFLLNKDGIIESWNEGAERIKGYSAQEVIGKSFSIFYMPEDIKRRHPEYELEKATQEGRYEEEGWRLRKNGTKFWANVVITALRDTSGKLIGFAKVTKDLSDKKSAEDKLKLSEERARRMFEGVKDYAMILLNPDGTIASWNEGARRIKGYESEDVIGKYFSIFYSYDDVKMGKCEYELKEAAETGLFEDEGWRIRKDGTRFWASVVITAIREKGRILGFSKVTRDMTENKRANDLLKMAYASLEKRVMERTKELSEKNKQLEEAIRTRDEFLSIASHELRTPLTPLKLQIQGLLYNLKRKNLEKMSEERIERISHSCERSLYRLTSLLENLLDVSRINLGKLVLTFETFNLSEMAQNIFQQHETEIANYGSPITLNCEEKVIGSFDHLRIEQVFVNLLTNAMKYGTQKPIHIEVYSKNNMAVMSFKDQGMGVSAEDQKRIFQRFERVEQ